MKMYTQVQDCITCLFIYFVFKYGLYNTDFVFHYKHKCFENVYN